MDSFFSIKNTVMAPEKRLSIADVDFNDFGYQMAPHRPTVVWTVGPGNTYPASALNTLAADAIAANELSHRDADARNLRKSLVGAIRRAYDIDGNTDWQVVIDKGGSELMQSALLGLSEHDRDYVDGNNEYSWDNLDEIPDGSVLVVHNDVFSGEATKYLADAERKNAVVKMESGQSLVPGMPEVSKLVKLVKSGKLAALHLTMNATTEGAQHSREVVQELRTAIDDSGSPTVIIGDNVSGLVMGVTHNPDQLAHVEYTSGQKQAGAGSGFGFAVINDAHVRSRLEANKNMPFQGHRFGLLSHLKKGELQRTTTPAMMVERVADGVFNAMYPENGDASLRNALNANRIAAIAAMDRAMARGGDLSNQGYTHVTPDVAMRSETVRSLQLPGDLVGRSGEIVQRMAAGQYSVSVNTGYGKDRQIGLNRVRTGYFGWVEPDAIRVAIQKLAQQTHELR